MKHVLRRGVVFYGGNFAVRAAALAPSAASTRRSSSTAKTPTWAAGCTPAAASTLRDDCYVHTSARRYRAMGTWAVIGLYVRNFWSEILRHRPSDRAHVDVR